MLKFIYIGLDPFWQWLKSFPYEPFREPWAARHGLGQGNTLQPCCTVRAARASCAAVRGCRLVREEPQRCCGEEHDLKRESPRGIPGRLQDRGGVPEAGLASRRAGDRRSRSVVPGGRRIRRPGSAPRRLARHPASLAPGHPDKGESAPASARPWGTCRRRGAGVRGHGRLPRLSGQGLTAPRAGDRPRPRSRRVRRGR